MWVCSPAVRWQSGSQEVDLKLAVSALTLAPCAPQEVTGVERTIVWLSLTILHSAASAVREHGAVFGMSLASVR